ncbi:MAG: hypothetical protein HYU27_05470 [Acidobacteria bacterium]|nr:hypothetical protein [Acidobacteriota bacterium]
MSDQTYNYSVFDVSPNEFIDFATHAPKVTMRARSFPLEDLATGKTVEMKDFWKTGIVVIEFGSFT